jgi:NADH dehydrogenase FAD-containing subunit
MAPPGGRGGIELVLNSRVAAVRKGEVDVFSTATGTTEVIPFGACVWSTGVAMHPLVKKLQARRAAATPRPAPAARVPGCSMLQHARKGV